jgi:hypothetical protein
MGKIRGKVAVRKAGIISSVTLSVDLRWGLHTNFFTFEEKANLIVSGSCCTAVIAITSIVSLLTPPVSCGPAQTHRPWHDTSLSVVK